MYQETGKAKSRKWADEIIEYIVHGKHAQWQFVVVVFSFQDPDVAVQ